MASSIQILRSNTAKERPFPGNLLDGQPALNTNSEEPGLFFKASDGSIVKIGPAAITSDGNPPNTGGMGQPGNTIGELWLDKSANPPILKVYDGAQWVDAGSGGGSGQVTLLRWSALATAGQTVLSGADSSFQQLAYTAGLEEVYINGAFLRRGVDYTATNGLTITLSAPLALNDEITVMAWTPFVIGSQIVDANVDPNAGITYGKLNLDNGIVNSDVNANAGVQASKLSFTQSGAGAVERTVEGKLRDAVSVKDFGAVGDGITDDSAALNLAFTAAGSAGISVAFAEGRVYAITSPLFIQNNTTVFGNGCTILIRRSDSTSASQITIGENCVVQDLLVNLAPGFTIRRGILIGNNSTIFRCSFTSTDQNPAFSRSSGFLLLTTNNVVIDGCNFVNWDRTITCIGCNNNWITNCYFESYVQGVNIQSAGTIFISNSKFNLKSPNATINPGHNAIAGAPDNIIVSDVSIYEAGEHGIYFSDVQYPPTKSATITGVKLDQLGKCGIKLRGYERVTIGNVQVIDCSYDSVTRPNKEGIRLETCKNVLINGYRVSKKNKSVSCYSGAYLSGCENVSIFSFFVDSPVRSGIEIEDYIPVTGSSLVPTFTASNILCQGLTVLNPGHSGVSVGTETLATTLGLSTIILTGLVITNPVNSAIFFNHTGALSLPLAFSGSVSSSLNQLVNNVSATSGLTFDLLNLDPVGGGPSNVRREEFYAKSLRPGNGSPLWTSGSGDPNGVITAEVGSLYTRTDGGASTVLYVKETGAGNVGWVAK